MDIKQTLKLIAVFILGYIVFFHFFDGAPDSSGSLELGSVIPGESKAEALYTAPDFNLKDFKTGEEKKLSDYKGKVVILSFWATWCNPCLNELPWLNQLGQKSAGSFEVVTVVSLGYNEKILNALINDRKLDHLTVLLDEDDLAATRYAIRSVPTTLIIDAEGVVRYRLAGDRHWHENDAIQDIQKVIELNAQQTKTE